jgi:hypothetical protein
MKITYQRENRISLARSRISPLMAVPNFSHLKRKEMKFPSKAKSQDNCALSDCCCYGSTEFRSEFEAYLCDHHYSLIVNMGWRDRNL